MSEFTYTKRNDGVIIRSDGVVVSNNPQHSDREMYEAWLAEGNKPEQAKTVSGELKDQARERADKTHDASSDKSKPHK